MFVDGYLLEPAFGEGAKSLEAGNSSNGSTMVRPNPWRREWGDLQKQQDCSSYTIQYSCISMYCTVNVYIYTRVVRRVLNEF